MVTIEIDGTEYLTDNKDSKLRKVLFVKNRGALEYGLVVDKDRLLVDIATKLNVDIPYK